MKVQDGRGISPNPFAEIGIVDQVPFQIDHRLAIWKAEKSAHLNGYGWVDRAKGVALRLYCITGQDIDQLAAAIQSRGGKLAQEPRDEPWGTRDFAVVDPDGFLISITTPVRT